MTPPLTLVICATPRTGGTLLCALLASSGVAGRPESWYRAEDRADYTREWGVPTSDRGQPDPAAYLAAAIRAGTGPDGTCGLRIQAQSLSPMLAELRTLFPDASTDRDALERAFGPCRFIHTDRRDDVAQAISRLKAEVSQVWHLDGTEDTPKAAATYDAARIDAYRAEAAAARTRWQVWFTREDIQPLRLIYEDFATDPVHHTAAILASLGRAPTSALSAPNRRMADRQSTAWAVRYRAERGLDGTALPR